MYMNRESQNVKRQNSTVKNLNPLLSRITFLPANKLINHNFLQAGTFL